MNGSKAQQLIYRGYGKAATQIGFGCIVYRSSSLLSPISPGNVVASNVPASFTTGFEYSEYNKPKNPFWTALIDGNALQIGDWVVGPQGTYYIADMQKILPIAAVNCNRVVSIVRPGYSGSGPMEQTDVAIASNLPIFTYTSGNRGKRPAGFPGPSETEAPMPELECIINSHDSNAIRKSDVIIDELGDRYVIETHNPTSFGHIVLARIEKP